MPSLVAIQTHADHWQDPLLWKPCRWISSLPAPPSGASELYKAFSTRQKSHVTPTQSTYLILSDGPQNCPGAKFAQVEFVDVLACLLRDHRVSVVCEPAESPELARKRALAKSGGCD